VIEDRAGVDPNRARLDPGQGALTFPLLRRHGELTAIEFDRDLHAPLQAAAREHGTLHLIQGDVLGVDFSALAAALANTGGQIRLVGNLPYNLSSPILFHALDHAAAVRDMHFMLQKVVDTRPPAPA
jgi:16S rRNA (adenine1518-N6/adenine1519-N6)-dimethyltransferase